MNRYIFASDRERAIERVRETAKDIEELARQARWAVEECECPTDAMHQRVALTAAAEAVARRAITKLDGGDEEIIEAVAAVRNAVYEVSLPSDL